MNQRPKKLLDQVREAIQVKHYSIRTEQAYVNWIKRYILFHDKRHPREMGASTTNDTPARWAPPKSRLFSPIWLLTET
jgi:hypothetical protein